MKKILLLLASSVIGLILLFLALAYFVAGYTPVSLYHTPNTATGIGAKLACSLRYITGYEKSDIATDIETYAPVLTRLEYTFDDADQSVSASFLNIKTRTAHYLPGIGCEVDYPGYEVRSTIQWPVMQPANAAWPKGNGVLTHHAGIQQKLDAMLASDNANGHDTRALLVAHNGRIVAESYADQVDADTPMLGWSMTKSVNALLLGFLERQGQIHVDDDHLFEQWQNDRRAEITVENLLQMTDGLNFTETYDISQPIVTMLFETPDIAGFMKRRKPEFAPGTHFRYSSGTANLLSSLIQQRIEGGVQDDINTLVNGFFRPLGMTSIRFETDASGLLIGSSYLYATARDWAKVGQLMLNGGEINGHRLVTRDYIRRALTPNSTEDGRDYGYMWWLNKGGSKKRWADLPEDTFAAMGNREQRVVVVPEDELVVVRLGWSPKPYITNENVSEIRRWFE